MKNAEAAAAKAAYERSTVIEEAMAETAAIQRQADQHLQEKVRLQIICLADRCAHDFAASLSGPTSIYVTV